MRNALEYDLRASVWTKSSYSQAGDECLEVTNDFPTVVPVRDSKNPQGPKLVFRAEAWAAFVKDVKAQ
ncbi:DUF397 domain-containing protein [Streptomyces sp. NBC_00847]|uniref:DUF397 domain-containing protein n=1 Tax=Streptomyces sp. NBC_00847 TaxID=2975850 RepID=UPI00224EB09D|nr:DUF397 domain-containing protein [Streptomyces sp. NBC_00847]MCX4881705.1 DUF397 domain-containing protein [Streptomyces sp. NBC_00847]